MLELYIKIGLLCVGGMLVLSSLVNVPAIVSKLLIKNKPAKTNTNDSDNQTDFLEIVSLWYQLKNKCDHCNLHIASTKLDEVFPLLNGVLDDEKTA